MGEDQDAPGYAHLGYWEGEGASHLHAQQQMKCAHTFAHLGPHGCSHLEDSWGAAGEGGGFPAYIWGTKDLRDVHIWEGWAVWGMQLHSDPQLERSLMSQLDTQLKARGCSSTSGEPGGFHLCTSGGTR